MASIGSSYNVPPTDAASSADIVIGISGTGGAGALEAAIGAARSGIAEYLDPDRTRNRRRRERSGIGCSPVRRSGRARRRAVDGGGLRRRFARPASPAVSRSAGSRSRVTRPARGCPSRGRPCVRCPRRQPASRRDTGTCPVAGAANHRRPDGLRHSGTTQDTPPTAPSRRVSCTRCFAPSSAARFASPPLGSSAVRAPRFSTCSRSVYGKRSAATRRSISG